MKCKWCGKNTVGRFCRGNSCKVESEAFNKERQKKERIKWIAEEFNDNNQLKI